MKLKKLPLIVKILIAIALGVGFGLIAPGWAVRAMNTFDGIFDQLLRFFIPLIIIGLVTPAIAEVGAKAGKMLVITVVLAYTFTVLSGLFAYSFSSAWFPSLLDRDSLDVIDAGEGDDTVQGYAGNDTIIGGKGNDFLVGGSGVDTYFFGVGDGQDTINNYDQENWSQDAIVFEDGVLPEDIRISRSGSNMVLTNDRTGDRVTVQNAYNDSRGWNYLGWIEFSDRSMWGMETLKEKTKVLNGTEEADVIEGNPWGYNYDQSEIISTYGGNDVIRAGAGDDSIDAGTGNDMVYGESGNDTITGGTGNDSLMGGYGADTYIFGMGDGQDTINNYDQTNWSEDKIVFLEGILPDDITVTRSGADMVLTNHNSGDKITFADEEFTYNAF